jgi:hypothetical protein
VLASINAEELDVRGAACKIHKEEHSAICETYIAIADAGYLVVYMCTYKYAY